MKLSSPFWLLIISVLLSSCALAPVKIQRVMEASVRHMKEPSAASLHDLLTAALQEKPDSPLGEKALSQFVERWKNEKRQSEGMVEGSSNKDVKYHVSFEGDSSSVHTLNYFDEIQPASELKITRLQHHQRPGMGAPLLALRENRNTDPLERFFPPEAITRPLTAVAEAGQMRHGIQNVRIQLLCSLQNETVLFQGNRQPLAADFSVPWAATLSRSGKLRQSGILDMLRRAPKRQPQLYLMEAYDPKKEPLIMIHGLLSTPLAWATISNDLWAAPAVRKRYQIWHFLYNTSALGLYSARILRNQLLELRSLLDPEGDDPAMQKTTLLTHSMGGLIGKALVVKPGDSFWKAAFKVPHETLNLTPDDRAKLEDAFEWQPDPTIHRIIFICTPHRGSDFADNPIGRIGGLLTSPPTPFQKFYQRVSTANPGVFTPEYQLLGQGRLDSVSSLSPRQPTLRILAELPMSPGVKTHSIIGNRGRAGPLEKSSDGIVPYTSSHLETADSELVVPTGHGAFHDPKAMAEILRILRLN